MKPFPIVIGSLSLFASSCVCGLSPVQAATTSAQTIVNATMPDYVVLSLQSPTVSIISTTADLTTNHFANSSLFGITIKSNHLGDVTVSAKTLLAGDGRVNNITPTDLRLKVANEGNGSTSNSYNAFKAIPTAAPQTIWTQFAEAPRTESFQVQFQHNNVQLYTGKPTPYTNTVQFTATTN